MKFRTELKNYQQHPIFNYSKKILCIGSCFAENIHNHLVSLKFRSFLNPCGITYNPISISNSIYHLLGRVSVREDEILDHRGIYFHYDFHSDYSATSKEKVMSNITEQLEAASDFSDPDILIISLGTAFTYVRKDTHEVVNNCHKVPQQSFDKKLLEVDEVVEVLQNAIDELVKVNPKLQVVVTVSPVRHLRDGMIENNQSKSTLLLAVSRLKNVIYFPSYELLLDDLRDYRFYGDDLVHPSSAAVKYILQFFENAFFDEKEKELRNEIISVHYALNHRPMFPESEQHRKFLTNFLEKMKTIHASGLVDYSKEMEMVYKNLGK